MSTSTLELPIHAVRDDFARAFAAGPVVVTSPTGSGKSTEVPRWLASLGARVLVVEPRRVACRTLAGRVAELEGSELGAKVGYAVRDDACHGASTRILFATPGIVLRARALTATYDVLVLDELHERSLELDLLFALFARRADGPKLVVMSATLDAERVSAHLGAVHVAGAGRTFPVDVRYLGSRSGLPEVEDLGARVRAAVERAASDTGDVLVFLPGKGEIEATARAVAGLPYELVRLHGGLSPTEQRRAFLPASRRKLILSTNVAETSVTIPGVSVVVDGGLVRRSRYHDGRSFLTLAPISDDAATQRAGRAGRTGPGVAYRLWSASARLAPSTPPEVHRESLVPLVLHAAAWGAEVEALPFLDPPKPYAIASAREELRALGALAPDASLSEGGRALFELPLDPKLGRMLLEARRAGTLDDVLDLVAALSIGRPLRLSSSVDGDLLRDGDCDASALVRVMRRGDPADPTVSASALAEARAVRTRLRRAEGMPETPPSTELDRAALVRTALAADPRAACVARVRGRRVAYANGGPELELARESMVGLGKPPEAIIAFESRAFGAGKDARILVTAASPVSLDALARAGLGELRLGHVTLERGRVVAQLERVYAGEVLSTAEETPRGALAREALATLYLRGSLFRDARAASEERLARAALGARLGPELVGEALPSDVPDLPTWVARRLVELGVEHGDDLALLGAHDLLAPDVPDHVRRVLDQDHPRSVNLGDATYRAEFDLEARRVTLVLVRGQRLDPPPLSYLPKYPGLSIAVSTPRGMKVLRARG